MKKIVTLFVICGIILATPVIPSASGNAVRNYGCERDAVCVRYTCERDCVCPNYGFDLDNANESGAQNSGQTVFTTETAAEECPVCGKIPGEDCICGGTGGNGTGSSYIDEDGDGVCDRYESGGSGGARRGAGNGGGSGTGPSYVDEDGDGVCERYESGGGGGNARQGAGHRRGRGSSR